MQQLLSVGCLSIAAKMEETLVPRCLDFQVGQIYDYLTYVKLLPCLRNGVSKSSFLLSQVCGEKYKFSAESIKNMEIFLMTSLNWRMQAVTPFSYINYFTDKFIQGKPLSCGFASRCTELILGTLKGRLYILLHAKKFIFLSLCQLIHK